ncbi:phosphoribosyltransferase [Pontibacter cellulosilyticus]|uniref:Phosphoribosyltransferase n=1 Tax=Pontibacter cellulosilyticus TaxID=1720253 RepID=A0A923N6T0_9BACT|nr:phosphoribosyltransferase family protein [Pontibacter cellulosilyticus]MBC5993718.1 phosphoribosyltransferase [Pontibacter cellulosilyticus]
MNMIHNRESAARELAQRLQKYKGEQGVVLAIPRGGVPVAAPIAKSLGMPLEVTLTKKIGHPANPEFAIGAVSLKSIAVDERAEVPHEYVEREVQRIRESLKQKYKLFLGDREHIALKDKVVIIVDDGIATGKTLEATVKLVKQESPEKIVIAVPVAPAEAIARFESMVDEVVCLLVPPFFQAVGQFYEEFYQTSDEEVIQLMQDQGKE